MGKRTQQVIDLVSSVCALILCVLLVTLSIPYVMQSFNIGEGSPDPGGLPYRFIVKSMIPLGFVFLGLQSLASVLRALAPFIDEGTIEPPKLSPHSSASEPV
jgi:TRAP-type mannitol/chloroaromatic compound transport system permease small subunit